LQTATRAMCQYNSQKSTSDAYFDGVIVKFVNDKLTGGAVRFVNGQKTRRAALLQITTCFHNFTWQDHFYVRQYFTSIVDNHDCAQEQGNNIP